MFSYVVAKLMPGRRPVVGWLRVGGLMALATLIMFPFAWLGAALASGTNTWLVLKGGFGLGWHAAWGNPLGAMLWTLVFGPAAGVFWGRHNERARQRHQRNPFLNIR